MALLKRLRLEGFKSIREMDLELRPLNVLIGANGAGKSNLVSFFKMIGEMAAGRMQSYIAASGRAHSLLYYGPGTTSGIHARLVFEDPRPLFEDGSPVDSYEFHLSYAADDSLYFQTECLLAEKMDNEIHAKRVSLGTGQREALFRDDVPRGKPTAIALDAQLRGCRAYHFHDTSATSRIRQYGYVGDNQQLLSDGANLAAFLYRLQNTRESSAYNRIVRTIRLAAPFFHDFDLLPTGPNDREILLNWRHPGSDQIFGPHQLSDGTLRAMCLIALLLQPEEALPKLIVVDEPELGLHPYALNLVASLLKAASHDAQILVTTQSSSFLDQFDPEDIIVVDREGKESSFRRPSVSELEPWLEEYSLGEVWEKNVIGGGPD